MGAACCVAAKDGTVICGSPVTAIQRHSHYSPSWSFRWDNRGRVVGEETTADWLRNEGHDDDRMDVKSGTTAEATCASDEGSPLDSLKSLTWMKSPSEGKSKNSSFDPIASRYRGKVKESFGSSSASCPSPSGPCVSSTSVSPMSSSHTRSVPNAASSRGHHASPARPLVRQVSDSRILEYRSPTFSISEEPFSFPPLLWGNESTRNSNVGSSEPAFSEHLASTPRERLSFDSEASGISHEKMYRNSGRKTGASFDLQACGICSKLLTERSSWSWTTQKLLALNEISVVSVLICGHVYHGECLEYMTPDVNKYDPPCPICTFGAKKTTKMCNKALRAEFESMARRSKKSVVISSNVHLDTLKTGEINGTSKHDLSSGSHSVTGKPFLKRHFSLGSGTSKSMSKKQPTPRKSFLWAKSSKY